MASGDGNSHLVDMMSQMMSKIDYLSDQVNTLGHRMSAMEKNVENLRGQMSDHSTNTTTYNIVEQARHGIASLVCFNHAYNITFYGLPQRPRMSVEDMFRNFMVDTLHIKPERALNMAIFVQQTGKLSPQDAYPPVCVAFCSTKDLELVQGKTKSKGSKLKKEQGIWAKWMWHDGVRVMKSY